MDIGQDKVKFRIEVSVFEHSDGKHYVSHSVIDNDSTMKDVGLGLYRLKQIEQELIDRVWDDGGEGYEIVEDDDDGDKT